MRYRADYTGYFDMGGQTQIHQRHRWSDTSWIYFQFHLFLTFLSAMATKSSWPSDKHGICLHRLWTFDPCEAGVPPIQINFHPLPATRAHATKVSLITVIVCKKWLFCRLQHWGSVHVVTWKLDLDQTSVAYTHTKRHKCDQTRFLLQEFSIAGYYQRLKL